MSSSRPQPSPRQQYRQIAPGQRIAPQSAPPKRTPLAVKVIVGSIVGLLALGTLGFCSAVLVAITGEAPAAAPNPSHDVELQTPAQQLRRGKVNARTQGLDRGQLHKASRLGAWLTRWPQIGIEHSDDPAAEVRRLARSYKATGVASRKVTTLLDEAASQLDQARDATDRGSYSAAIRHHKEAAAKLKGVAPRVRADAKRTEHATGARISGRKTASSTNYNYLFPLTVKTSTAKVIRWIDGDTVVTTRGRVRLLGIDTPELKGPCSQARAAKEYAESLAPPGTTVVLTNPASVDNRDRYGRLLVYVDLVGNDSDKTVTEVGYSLLLSSLAVARYDSVDGYQWHPREHLYRNTAAAPADGSCMRGTEQEAFVSAASRAAHHNTDEYWRKRLLGKALDTPHSAARKLTKTAEHARQRHNEQVQRERELARQRELDRARETYDNDTNGNNDDRGKGGGYDGYTGPRCYAPGGKTWKPC